jgi:hypothetical protein
LFANASIAYGSSMELDNWAYTFGESTCRNEMMSVFN